MSTNLESTDSQVTVPLHLAKFHGKASDFYRIWIVNLLLTILTFGIYSAWAKVRNLKFFYGSTELAGARFDFHGEPIAILKGRVLAAIIGSIYLFGGHLSSWISLLGLLLLFVALPWIVMKSFRFRLANTSYRNVRFSFRGKIEDGYKIWFKFISWPLGFMVASALLTAIWGLKTQADFAGMSTTQSLFYALGGLGIMVSWFVIFPRFYAAALQFFYNNVYYGGSKASIQADLNSFNKQVYMPTVVRMLGAFGIIVLGVFAMLIFNRSPMRIQIMLAFIFGGYLAMGMATLYFMFARMIYVWSRLTLDSQKTQITMKYSSYFSLVVTNLLASGLTFGLLFPWAKVRHQKFLIESRGIHMDSFDKFVGIANEKVSSLGEEASSTFDVDFDIGL